MIDDLGLDLVVTPQHSAPNRFIPGFLAYSVAVVLKWPSGRSAAAAAFQSAGFNRADAEVYALEVMKGMQTAMGARNAAKPVPLPMHPFNQAAAHRCVFLYLPHPLI